MRLASLDGAGVPADQPPQTAPSQGRRPPIGLLVAAAFAAIAALTWITAVAVSAGHGFDTSDEAYYLLSYRWWDTNFRTFTGIQYLYGPVFELLGYDIAGLRLFRLLTVIACHLTFGWTFMRWLRLRRPAAPASRLWEIAGMAAILAAGGLVYGWLPLSPGYNDVSLLGSLLLAAIALTTATATGLGRAVPAWVAAAFGPVLVVMTLAKWASAIVTVGLVGLAIVITLWPRGWRQVLRFILWALAGAVLTVAAFQLFIVSLTTALPEMLTVNRLAASNTNAPTYLLSIYWHASVNVVKQMVKVHALLTFAAVFSLFARRPAMRRIAVVLACAGLAFSVWRVIAHGGLAAGTVNLDRYPANVVATFALIAVIGAGARWRAVSAPARPRGLRAWPVFGMLLLLPFAQAMGTGNPIHMMAVNAFAVWMAIMLAIYTGFETLPVVSRALATAALALGVALSACIGVNGVLLNPYRTAAFAHTTEVAAGVPALSSVRLDPATAQDYSDLYRRVKPYVEPDGRAIMAFDEMAGFVLLLGGRSVGEAWYSQADPERTYRGIEAECAKDKPWWGDRKPILIFRRPVSEGDVHALKSCGLVIGNDYRLLAPKEETMGLSVYVPAAETANG
jgi:hypothetical protein